MIPPEVLKLAAGRADAFETDPDAPEGSYEFYLHKARLAIEARRGRGIGRRRVHFKRASEIVLAPPERTLWLVPGVIPALGVVAVPGEPKTVKSWTADEIAMAVANAVPAFGEFVPPEAADVALFKAEDSEPSERTRLIALARGHGLDPAKATGRIYLQCRGSLDLRTEADLCAVIAAVWMIGATVKLVVLDPLRDVHGAQENDGTEMALVMGNLRLVRDVLECCVLFVHHTHKAGPDTAERRPGQRMRGSTVIHAAIDAGFYMSLKSGSETSWTNRVLVETKTGRAAGAFELTLDVEDDANGEATCARWTFNREASGKGSGENLSDSVLSAITQKPGSGSEIARRLHRTKEMVLKTCTDLETDGLIQKVGHIWHPVPNRFGTASVRGSPPLRARTETRTDLPSDPSEPIF